MRHDAYRPLTVQELAEAFAVQGGDGFRAFIKRLNRLEEVGEVVRTRTDRYGVPERMNLVVGRLQMKARGYGFLLPETPGEADVYIPASDMNGALSGDKIMARVEKVTNGGARREGKVIRVLERAENRIVGKLIRHRDHAFVTPLDKRFPQDLFIGKDDMMDAHDGYVVVADITEYPTDTRGPEGRVVEVLGHPDAPGIDILGVVRKYGLAEAFPDAVLQAAEAIPVELTARDYEGRRDLRGEVIVTIDGEDAKDLDDAVQVEQLDNGNYRLGVHIADVGYYVKEGSTLDKEAYKRGTSVYLVDRVIPMLPQRLSNNICSLNPQVDRLTLSCEMEVTTAGEVVRHDVFPSVIRTTERMTYANVRRILVNHDEGLIERYRSLVPMFEQMEELAQILNTVRMQRGAIDFNFDEVKVVVDDDGHPVDIVPRPRSVAERIIEEFMLAANETVAQHFHLLDVPFIYRIHEEPTLEKMLEYNEFVYNFGYSVRGVGKNVKPRALQDILEKAAGTREERVIATLMLRSMRQARYASECVGHFGLAAEFYTHFTSPIRRYPDLCIHRIMREVLDGKLGDKRTQKLREFVEQASLQASERERVAQDAERECDQLKMVEFMQEHLGEKFDGLISGVTQFGLFIQLQNGVEGLIHVSYLNDDYYVLNEKQMALVGERTRRVFRLGDPVRVEAMGASKENLTIDFSLVSHHREGTLVAGEGVETVIYDEDLEAGDRKRAIHERSQRSRDRNGSRPSFTAPTEGRFKRESEQVRSGRRPNRSAAAEDSATPDRRRDSVEHRRSNPDRKNSRVASRGRPNRSEPEPTDNAVRLGQRSKGPRKEISGERIARFGDAALGARAGSGKPESRGEGATHSSRDRQKGNRSEAPVSRTENPRTAVAHAAAQEDDGTVRSRRSDTPGRTRESGRKFSWAENNRRGGYELRPLRPADSAPAPKDSGPDAVETRDPRSRANAPRDDASRENGRRATGRQENRRQGSGRSQQGAHAKDGGEGRRPREGRTEERAAPRDIRKGSAKEVAEGATGTPSRNGRSKRPGNGKGRTAANGGVGASSTAASGNASTARSAGGQGGKGGGKSSGGKREGNRPSEFAAGGVRAARKARTKPKARGTSH